jgi:hypothetical protein
MDAYEAAFKITPVLLRYPAGDDSLFMFQTQTGRLVITTIRSDGPQYPPAIMARSGIT